ncbi:uncharacterized protein [Apostichopus japonicus]|uniref:uncharacterized protein n=1 Tax=Stichopus japonicus TaxID=307972 RepID=UPI003AB20370
MVTRAVKRRSTNTTFNMTYRKIGTDLVKIAVQPFVKTLLLVGSLSLSFAPVIAAVTELPQISNTLQESLQKAVLDEEQNEGCFQEPYSGRNCRAGYRKQREGENCHGRYGCCICEHGTYQPYRNQCLYCIQKTFCPDYDLVFEDYGSYTNNSRCRKKTAEYIPIDGDDTLPQTNSSKIEGPTTATILTGQMTGEPDNKIPTTEDVMTLFSLLAKRPGLLLVIFLAIPACAIALFIPVSFCCWRVFCCTRPQQALLRMFCGEYGEKATANVDDPELVSFAMPRSSEQLCE